MDISEQTAQEPPRIIRESSPGGSVSGALALYDVMKAVSCPIRTVCLWEARGAAALLLAAGDRRDILPHGRVSLHIPVSSRLGMGDASPEPQNSREWAVELLAQLTEKSREETEAALQSESWLSAEEAMAFGLTDCVIEAL